MRTYLFIGGAGFIGSNTIRALLNECGNSCKIFVLEPAFANTSRLTGMNITLLKGSLSDIDYIIQIIENRNIDTIVHLVSTMIPGSNYDDYVREFETVIFPTVRIMQLCSQKRVRFVFFSSGGTVYGERKSFVPFLESDPKEPISYYGLSKQMIENSILFEHRTSNLQYLILRPSNPYGFGQNLKGNQGLIAVSLGKIFSREKIVIWGDGSSVRDYIYISDLAQAVVSLLQQDVVNTTINIGSGVGHSVREVVETITSIVDEDVKVEYTPKRKNDVSNMILDNSVLRRYVDLKFVSLTEGIEKFYLDVKHSIGSYE